MPNTEVAAHEHYLAEANAELDAMLGEVGELDAPQRPERAPGRSWVHLIVVAVIAVAVFTLGLLLLRGRKPARMSMHVR